MSDIDDPIHASPAPEPTPDGYFDLIRDLVNRDWQDEALRFRAIRLLIKTEAQREARQRADVERIEMRQRIEMERNRDNRKAEMDAMGRLEHQRRIDAARKALRAMSAADLFTAFDVFTEVQRQTPQPSSEMIEFFRSLVPIISVGAEVYLKNRESGGAREEREGPRPEPTDR